MSIARAVAMELGNRLVDKPVPVFDRTLADKMLDLIAESGHRSIEFVRCLAQLPFEIRRYQAREAEGLAATRTLAPVMLTPSGKLSSRAILARLAAIFNPGKPLVIKAVRKVSRLERDWRILQPDNK